jgi:ABC-type transport system involved in cytochrome bd biosynthesis fused ATPase/permease subunit
MKRRLALARALLVHSQALALDEPFTGLDGENREICLELIAEAAREKAVLLVTHDEGDAGALDARIIRL